MTKEQNVNEIVVLGIGVGITGHIEYRLSYEDFLAAAEKE